MQEPVGRVVPDPDTPTVNFAWLKEYLLSKDLSRMDEMDWVDRDEFRQLDQQVDTSLTGDRISFQSFARSGNTLLRRFLEQITGVYTGSDMDIRFTYQLLTVSVGGEGHTNSDNRVWISKTHYPVQTPGTSSFITQRNIIVVRNPIDVFPSLSLLMN